MTPDVSVLAAFIAGILSITSPCVLPLLPIYMAHLAGVTDPADASTQRRRLLLNASAYVLGFSTVFVAIGIAFGAAGSLVSAASVVSENRYWLVRIGGVVLVVLGLHQIGIVRIGFLDQERRLAVDVTKSGRVATSFLIGVTFAAGWSPCAGPILGAILTMAAGEADVRRAAFLLLVYSAGLGLPFIALALFGASSGILRKIAPRLQTVTTVSGAVMLAMGVLMILGIYQQFFTRMVAAAPWTPWEPSV